MNFKGNGSIWNPAKNRILVDFNADPIFETDNPAEIELLKLSGQAFVIVDSVEDIPVEIADFDDFTDEPIKLSKKEIIEILKERDIDFNPRDKKETLESLIYQE